MRRQRLDILQHYFVGGRIHQAVLARIEVFQVGEVIKMILVAGLAAQSLRIMASTQEAVQSLAWSRMKMSPPLVSRTRLLQVLFLLMAKTGNA